MSKTPDLSGIGQYAGSFTCHFEKCYLPVNVLMEEHAEQSFRASAIDGCYWILYQDHFNPQPFPDSTYSIFDQGTMCHSGEEIMEEGAQGLLGQEQYFAIQRDKFHLDPLGQYYITGHLDKRKLHPFRGLFIEDLKTTNLDGLMYLVVAAKKIPWIKPEHIKQVSTYSFMDYVYTKITTLQGRIRFIDRMDCLKQHAEPFPLWTPLQTQEWIENHPGIIACLTYTPEIAIKASAKEFANPDHFPCHWSSGQCRFFEGCPCITYKEEHNIKSIDITKRTLKGQTTLPIPMPDFIMTQEEFEKEFPDAL